MICLLIQMSQVGAFMSQLKSVATVTLCVLALLSISACSSKTYKPEEHSIYDKHVRDFEVSGKINVTSINMKENPQVIYKRFSTVESSYQEIASLMAMQLEKEIKENSTIDGESDKNLYIQLDRFYFEPGAAEKDFHIDFTLIGERGFEKQFRLSESSRELSSGGLEKSFNNAIAMSVKKILRDGRTLQYMASNSIR